MPPVSPTAPLLCVLFCVSAALQRYDLGLAYVTHSSFFYYSCSQDPQPCSISSLTDCRCKDILPHLHSPPFFRMRRLTVWFTSPLNTVRLLNNSEVRHLTLINCGTGETRGMPSSFPKGHFSVLHLERLTVVNLPQRPVYNLPDGNRAKSTDLHTESDRKNAAHLDINSYNRGKDIKMDLFANMKKDSLAMSSAQIQDLLLGRELGAAYQEQARLGIIHSSVLDWGTAIKAYTVQTHIDNEGMLPFPDLHLPVLPKTSIIYVSFVY